MMRLGSSDRAFERGHRVVVAAGHVEREAEVVPVGRAARRESDRLAMGDLGVGGAVLHVVEHAKARPAGRVTGRELHGAHELFFRLWIEPALAQHRRVKEVHVRVLGVLGQLLDEERQGRVVGAFADVGLDEVAAQAFALGLAAVEHRRAGRGTRCRAALSDEIFDHAVNSLAA